MASVFNITQAIRNIFCTKNEQIKHELIEFVKDREQKVFCECKLTQYCSYSGFTLCWMTIVNCEQIKLVTEILDNCAIALL